MAAGAGTDALAASGDTVYAGGTFTLGSRTNLVALKTSDASVASGWTTSPTAGGAVTALALDGSNLYVGGSFTNVSGSSSHPGLALLSAASGAVTGSFDADATGGGVRALAIVDNVIFAGGDFTSLGATTRPGLAAVGKASGALVSTWPPAVAKSQR